MFWTCLFFTDKDGMGCGDFKLLAAKGLKRMSVVTLISYISYTGEINE